MRAAGTSWKCGKGRKRIQKSGKDKKERILKLVKRR